MFFTSISQMMTESVDLTLVIHPNTSLSVLKGPSLIITSFCAGYCMHFQKYFIMDSYYSKYLREMRGTFQNVPLKMIIVQL